MDGGTWGRVVVGLGCEGRGALESEHELFSPHTS